MRIAQINGRAAMIIRADEYVDIATATGGRFPSDIASLYAHWDELNAWASETDCVGSVFDSSMLECPVSGARQIFAIGLNYADHAREAGVVPPSEPAVFTKFQTSLADPLGVVVLPDGNVDWEAELVWSSALGDGISQQRGHGTTLQDWLLDRTSRKDAFRKLVPCHSSASPSRTPGSVRSVRT